MALPSVLQGAEGSVPDPGYASDLVSLPLAVAGCSLSFPGYRVLLLLDPTVFYVACQGETPRGKGREGGVCEILRQALAV
jgi:hypothetical protein